MSGATDSRLLPRGFAWGTAILVVYAVARTIAFGLDFHLVLICGVILSALLAAVYTHAKETTPPVAGKRAWAMGFWGLIVMMFLSVLGDIEMFLFPDPEKEIAWQVAWTNRREGAIAFIGFCLLGWVSVRGIYFARLRGNTPEGWAGAILLLLAAFDKLYYADESSLKRHLAVLAFFLIAIVCLFIHRRKERRAEDHESDNR